ncbi:MAG: helix-turn-helix transcriptional regulator [Chloroflexi bacterium]|nr:helix-turn-helix transcriptional regulator [Chloroflexota bacterium]
MSIPYDLGMAGVNITSDDDHAEASPASGPHYVQPVDLARLVREKRAREGLSLEQVARVTGVSAATLSRWERQRTDADPHKLAVVARWLGVELDPKAAPTPLPLPDPMPHPEGAGTVEMIEAHLRADRNLDPKTAAALARMVRAAYEQFAGTQTSEESESDA